MISGYLTACSVESERATGSFHYFRFVLRRLKRLMPLIILALCFCLAVGAWGMLPDDLENLAESVVASNW